MVLNVVMQHHTHASFKLRRVDKIRTFDKQHASNLASNVLKIQSHSSDGILMFR